MSRSPAALVRPAFVLLITLLLASAARAAVCPITNFGAVGNGIADDSNAIAAAFACAAAGQQPGGVVVFPSGIYRMAQAKVIANSHVTVEFQGATLKNDYFSGFILSFTGEHLTFEGTVTIDHNSSPNINTGLLFTGSHLVWKANTQVKGGALGYALNGYRITDAVFENLYTNDSHLLSVNQPRRLQVSKVRAALGSPISGVMIFLGSNQSYNVHDLSLSDIDLDLGGQEILSAIVIAPNVGMPYFDGVKISNLSIRNNKPHPVSIGGDGIDIIRCQNVTVDNAVFRDLNTNGINAAGNSMTLSNITAMNCGAPCVQIHDPSDGASYSNVALSNILVVNGGTNPAGFTDYTFAGIALAPYPGTGTLSLVKLHNVASYGSLQRYGFAITRNVSDVRVDASSFGGSQKTIFLENPNLASLSFSGPIGTSSDTLLLNNAYFDGVSWVRPDATRPALMLNLDALGRMTLSGAAAGGGAIPFATRLQVGADGALSWNGGSAIRKHLSASYNLNLSAPSSVPGCVQSAAQSLPGVAGGDALAAGITAALPAQQQLSAQVSAAGQVIVRVCQFGGAPADPDGAGATYRVDAWQH